jgi:hypothetical protein
MTDGFTKRLLRGKGDLNWGINGVEALYPPVQKVTFSRHNTTAVLSQAGHVHHGLVLQRHLKVFDGVPGQV